ncbi:hypothetical protein, partial [Paraburkholderia sp. XV]|uniref:hypothetical protein n=1 Tax=Paraburkholderia sp. XV TaxID=2831520 RepID=UPI001CD56A7F
RCRPAQGRRVKRANESRMAAQTLANQGQRPRHAAKTANASKKAKSKKQKAKSKKAKAKSKKQKQTPKNHIPNPTPRPR